HLLLRVRLEVDEQVPARDQVELRIRRIANQVVRREDDRLAQGVRNLIAVGLPAEEPIETFPAEADELFLRIQPRTGNLERRLVDVGREDLQIERTAPRRELLVQEDRDRVRLLAGGAARNPDADLVGRFGVLDDVWNDALLERR